ncbi:MAG: DUF4340 domain-containing protein, partial [Acidobacteriota bacterium]|nr:DUF4340 domain-containing protein [Acidobacteriota bacterium]
MRPRTLLVLLALVLGLGAFIALYERKLPSSEARAKEAKKVLDFQKDDVNAVTLDFEGSRLRLVRTRPAGGAEGAGKGRSKDDGKAVAEGGGPQPAAGSGIWRIAAPVLSGVSGVSGVSEAVRADSGAVDRLLDTLGNLEKTRTLEAVDRHDVGLDRPRGTVLLETSHGAKTLEIGAAVPTGGELVIGVAGRPGAYVVADAILADLRKKPGDWRDRQILHLDRDRIERVALLAGGQRVLLARRGDRFW